MLKRISIISTLCLLVLGANGQTMRQLKKAINEAFEKQEYHVALQFLDEIQAIDSTNMELQYKQAEAARLFNAYILAEKRYKQVLESELAKAYPEAEFWLATVQKLQGKYDEAIFNFNQYLLVNPDTLQPLPKEALTQIQACEWAKELIKFKDDDLKISQLDETINTVHSDFAPVKHGEQLFFSSLRFPSVKEKADRSKKYTKILELKETSGEAVPFQLGFENQDIHTAHLAFNKEATRMYFNVCEYTEGSIIKCKIYYRDKVGNQWGENKILPNYINVDGKTTTQPNLGYVEALDKEVLFFASDRTGGKGGLDIWYSPLDENGVPSPPQNLAKVNTDKDDFTPFFHDFSQTLYFSSDGRKSLGGHDIYTSTFQENAWTTPEHTGFPLNTSYNDVYFSLNRNGSEGYFASNREGTQLLEKEISACCYDVFKAEFNSFFLDLNVLTFAESEGQKTELAGTTITLYELFEDARKPIKQRIQPKGNRHFYRIKSSKNYQIVAEKEGFVSTTLSFNTDGVRPDEVLTKEVVLKKPQLQVLTFNGNLETPLNDVSVALQEIDKDGNPIETIPFQTSPSNEFFFPLKFNQHYRIVAQKEGFEKTEKIFSTFSLAKDQSLLVKEIILNPKPEEQVLQRKKLKPFPLYFDNDFPNPGSRDTVTEFTFPTTLAQYKARKNEFKAGYSRGLKGEQKIMAEYEVEQFFDIEMDATYKEFLKFTDAVLTRLEFGREVVISVQAYTSPLASPDYNLRLSKRRISSMLNFYRTYKDGAMRKYVDEGKLKIIMVAHGEKNAPTSISDNPMDRKNSVYSIEASKERKVVIEEVQTKRTSADNSSPDNE